MPSVTIPNVTAKSPTALWIVSSGNGAAQRVGTVTTPEPGESQESDRCDRGRLQPAPRSTPASLRST